MFGGLAGLLGGLRIFRPKAITPVAVAEAEVVPALAGKIPLKNSFIRGFTHAHLHAHGYGYGSGRSQKELEWLKTKGVSWVALNPFAYMPDIHSPAVRWGGDPTLSHEALIQEGQQARALGLKVLVKPHLWAWSFGAGSFPGDIEMRSSQDWERWFAEYGLYALEMAEVSEKMGAEAFCVGTELTRASLACPGKWAALVKEVREVFSGKLTYAANWYAEVEGFKDWAAFDFIGVNAYYPLADLDSPSEAQLLAGWVRWAKLLSAVAEREGKTVVFTEAGYEARSGAAKSPWGAGGSPDPELQKRAYSALLKTFVPQPWFEGVFWWKWFTAGKVNPIEQDSFCPEQGTIQLVKEWFT
jgi:hypothetical protein